MGASVSKDVEDAKDRLTAIESRVTDVSRDASAIKLLLEKLVTGKDPTAPSTDKADEVPVGLPSSKAEELVGKSQENGDVRGTTKPRRAPKRKKSMAAVDSSSQEETEFSDAGLGATSDLYDVARILSATKQDDGVIHFKVQWAPSPKQKKQKKGGDITTEPIDHLFPGSRKLVQEFATRQFRGNESLSQCELIAAIKNRTSGKGKLIEHPSSAR